MRCYVYKITQTIAVAAAALLFAASGGTACSQNGQPVTVESIRVGILKDLTAGPAVIADAQGYFAANGLNVTFTRFETGTQASAALAEGNLDIAYVTEFIMVRNILDNQPVRVIASDSKYEGVLLAARKSSGIDGVVALKGQRVGVNTDTVNLFYLSRLLERNGLSLRDITVVNGTQTQLINYYNAGELSAVVFSRIYVNQLEPQSDILTWPAQGNQTSYRLAVARADRITAYEELVEKYLRAIDAAEQFILNQPTDAKTIIAKQQNLDSGYIETEWPLTRFMLSLDLAVVAIMNDEAKWMSEAGLVSPNKIPDFAAFFYLDALRAVNRSAVTIIR
ncbi:MAG: ABC transporter substrate-binding protein [Dehalococcoidales bacterium]|nr:ABC transporter substrate-binding protein [Dehalococcoidales bacterium]